jgi:hypothetical protein
MRTHRMGLYQRQSGSSRLVPDRLDRAKTGTITGSTVKKFAKRNCAIRKNIGKRQANHFPGYRTIHRLGAGGPTILPLPNRCTGLRLPLDCTHDEPSPESLGAFLGLNIAGGKTYEDYRKAIPGLDCLSQNVAFASQ